MIQKEKIDKVAGKAIKGLIEFCVKEKMENPRMTMEATTASGEKYRLIFERTDLNQKDELFEKAKQMAIEKKYCSIFMLEKKLNIGHNRAGRIMDELEDAGIVACFEGNRDRRVLVQ